MGRKRLSDMLPGERGRVISIAGSSTLLRQRIMSMGLIRGTEVEVIRNAPLGDPMEFLLRGYNLTLRKEEAANVWVEVE